MGMMTNIINHNVILTAYRALELSFILFNYSKFITALVPVIIKLFVGLGDFNFNLFGDLLIKGESEIITPSIHSNISARTVMKIVTRSRKNSILTIRTNDSSDGHVLILLQNSKIVKGVLGDIPQFLWRKFPRHVR